MDHDPDIPAERGKLLCGIRIPLLPPIPNTPVVCHIGIGKVAEEDGVEAAFSGLVERFVQEDTEDTEGIIGVVTAGQETTVTKLSACISHGHSSVAISIENMLSNETVSAFVKVTAVAKLDRHTDDKVFEVSVTERRS